MLHRFAAALAAIVVAGCSLSPIQPAAPPVLAVTGGKIVDPDSPGPPVAGTILIAGDRIVAIGPTIRVPRAATVVRADGKFIVPGLWDMHSHRAAWAQFRGTGGASRVCRLGLSYSTRNVR